MRRSTATKRGGGIDDERRVNTPGDESSAWREHHRAHVVGVVARTTRNDPRVRRLGLHAADLNELAVDTRGVHNLQAAMMVIATEGCFDQQGGTVHVQASKQDVVQLRINISRTLMNNNQAGSTRDIIRQESRKTKGYSVIKLVHA